MPTISRDQLLDQITKLNLHKETPRKLIAIAGAPGSGKSTLANWLVERLNNSDQGTIAEVFAQDGFHYDDHVLKERHRLKFKGAEDTFDTQGLYATLKRACVEPEIAIPVFDRALEISRNCAKIIKPETRLLIVEGNYLLLNKPEHWHCLHPLFSMTVFLDVPEDQLQQRLITRWLDFGYSQEAALKKVMENDMINAVNVINNSVSADWIISEE